MRAWFTTAAREGSTKAEWSPRQRGTAVAICTPKQEQSLGTIRARPFSCACTSTMSAGLSGSAPSDVDGVLT